ncbi:hypothetical protein V5799_014857 [Amblyomma americanum]|uniref:C2H2-type domain-containing protein n=1 Tax=Amblyomma americanum TaxID=6943 RepID=A0AAQ4E1T8_AMBAM
MMRPLHALICLVCFLGNASISNRTLCKQEFSFYNVPSVNYYLPGANNERSNPSSTGLDSSTSSVTDLLAAGLRRPLPAIEFSTSTSISKPKEFACNICGRKFNLKCNLNRHNLVHTGVRNYGCEVCGQRFVLRQHLKKHLERHAKGC